MTKRDPAYSHRCRQCGAAVGKPCVSTVDGKERKSVHMSRYRLGLYGGVHPAKRAPVLTDTDLQRPTHASAKALAERYFVNQTVSDEFSIQS